jgi:hypothetical protein
LILSKYSAQDKHTHLAIPGDEVLRRVRLKLLEGEGVKLCGLSRRRLSGWVFMGDEEVKAVAVVMQGPTGIVAGGSHKRLRVHHKAIDGS